MKQYKARELQNIEFDGIDEADWPDLCDAYISYAENLDGVALYENKLTWINENFMK